MRRILLFLVIWAAVSAYAQKPPANLEPLPDIPPPPPQSIQQPDQSFEPQITIVRRKEATIEEYRIRGQLYMMKVTPIVGPPYYLVDDRGDGNFIRYDSLPTGLRVPRWVIRRF